MADRSKVLERIRNIRLLMFDKATSPEEAANYAEKVARLISEHQVSEDELDTEGNEPRFIAQPYQFSEPLSQRDVVLLGQCGIMMSVQTMVYNDDASVVQLIGRRLSIEATMEMFIRLSEEISKVASSYPMLDYDSLADGLSIGVAKRLAEQRLTMLETRLPVVMELDETEKFMNEAFNPDRANIDGKDIVRNSTSFLGLSMSDQIKINEGINE